jgi:hypothetical protein
VNLRVSVKGVLTLSLKYIGGLPVSVKGVLTKFLTFSLTEVYL